MLNVLVLAAGPSNSNAYPIGLTDLGGISLLERISSECSALEGARLVYTFAHKEVENYHLEEVVHLLEPEAVVVKVHSDTQGALASALLSADIIDTENELLILNCNEFVDVDFRSVLEKFRLDGCDAGVITFSSIQPRYSYVKLDPSEEYVVEASEKRPISNLATAGFYWYKSGSLFVESAKNQIRKDASVNGNYYICPVFNEYVLLGLRIGTFPIAPEKYHPLKNQLQIQRAELGFLGDQ